ncbi:unnamed protein product [Prorocentrum cordatum]|uniref:AP2/ERF domain-containing protein n=1 Tax=Prorocentrum cordatum TaxID=2364126 RepID=A0ABN9SJR7_9DINO|nr:unnamed protein product [Polarella glacialis]
MTSSSSLSSPNARSCVALGRGQRRRPPAGAMRTERGAREGPGEAAPWQRPGRNACTWNMRSGHQRCVWLGSFSTYGEQARLRATQHSLAEALANGVREPVPRGAAFVLRPAGPNSTGTRRRRTRRGRGPTSGTTALVRAPGVRLARPCSCPPPHERPRPRERPH